MYNFGGSAPCESEMHVTVGPGRNPAHSKTLGGGLYWGFKEKEKKGERNGPMCYVIHTKAAEWKTLTYSWVTDPHTLHKTWGSRLPIGKGGVLL